MCRTGTRHCRDSWSEEQKALENARRRVTRNTAKRDAATTDDARAKYDKLVTTASDQVAGLTSTIEQRKAEHLAASREGEGTVAETGEAPAGQAVATEAVQADAASTDAPSGSEAATEAIETIRVDDSTPTKPLPAPTTPTTRQPTTSTRRPTPSGSRAGSSRRRTSSQSGLLDAFMSFLTGNRENVLRANLERAGIEHSFQDGFLHIPKEAWTEDTHRVLVQSGLKEAPVSWTGDWVLPTSNHVGIDAPRTVA